MDSGENCCDRGGKKIPQELRSLVEILTPGSDLAIFQVNAHGVESWSETRELGDPIPETGFIRS